MSSQQNMMQLTAARDRFARVPRAVLGMIFAVVGSGVISVAWAQGSNRLERIEAIPLSANQVELRLHLSNAAPQPLAFTVDNPARISLDLPDTTIALPARRIDVKRGVLDTVTAAEANGRTRVVLNLDKLVPYETRVDGDVISVFVGASAAQGATAVNVAATETSHATSAPTPARSANTNGPRAINSIDFRRGSDGSARVIVELSDARIPVDLRQEGNRIVVNFAKTALPDSLLRRLDVVDFATPVSMVDAVRVGDSARLLISATGDWEQIAYQSDNIYTIEVKPISKLATALEDKKEYNGERLTLNFQDIETRAVLQLLADTSGQNMVITDSVKGNVTLRLQNVPWDQALDIVMRTKGLDMRREGNVMVVAPAAELAARDKELLTAKKEVRELSPLRTEYLQVNYAKASDLAALIKAGKGNSLLSERGNVSIDERTNTLLLQDTADRLADIRRLVSTLDIPVRQVKIEARIVIVNDNFTRDLGVRWGYSNINSAGNNLYTVTGSAAGAENTMTSVLAQQTAIAQGTTPVPPVNLQSGAGAYLVNLPASNPAGSIALALLGSNYLVDLELSAAQAEGRGEILSQPQVITANQKQAIIEQGVEIPYQQSASSGATTVAFKKAVLSLKVTPQITPDSSIILDLTVNKDSVGANVPTGQGGFVPSINTQTVTTQVLVHDGQTVVLGGILETTKTEAQNKIPFLGDIPGLGYIFREKTVTNNKQELLIFVTPKVLREGVAVN